MLLRLTQKEDQWLANNTNIADWGTIDDPNKITPATALEILSCIGDSVNPSSGSYFSKESSEGDQLIRKLAAFVAQHYGT